MTIDVEIIFKFFGLLATIGSSLFAYHKYIMSELNKKVDKDDCGKQQELLAEKRLNIEIMLEERTKTIFKKQEEIKEDLKIIKEHIIQK